VLAASIIRVITMEAASTSEMPVKFYQTTWRNNPEDSHLHTRCHENLRSHKKYLCFHKFNENVFHDYKYKWLEIIHMYDHLWKKWIVSELTAFVPFCFIQYLTVINQYILPQKIARVLFIFVIILETNSYFRCECL
jgi:hypothetical protein